MRPGTKLSPSVPFRYFATAVLPDARMLGWQTIIGIEVHAQMKSRNKLFSASLMSAGDTPNTHVTLFDGAFPGTLPKLNENCVKLGVRTALALAADVQRQSSFDRKHYFYPDLPSGYQITQNYAPLGKGGFLYLEKHDKHVRIKQIQLEQDTAKSNVSSTQDHVFIDLNRAGSGLMEIVSEPDMRSPEEAGAYVRTLQSVLRSIGASDGNMEQGSLRCDVNVSVNREGEPWGTRCEIKNLNSVRNLMIAINAEVFRQRQLIERGVPVMQETRGFDETTASTFKLRSKEDAPEYRYMPDPNLPSLILTESDITAIRNAMPELPHQTKARLQSQYGLNARDVDVLMSVGSGEGIGLDGEVSIGGAVQFFEEVATGREPKAVVNWVTHELLGGLAYRNEQFQDNPISSRTMGELVDLVQGGILTGTSAKTLLRHLLKTRTQEPLEHLIDSLGLKATGASSLAKFCETAISDLPKESSLVRSGNQKVLMKIVGHVMRLSKGTADAQAARAMLMEILLPPDPQV